MEIDIEDLNYLEPTVSLTIVRKIENLLRVGVAQTGKVIKAEARSSNEHIWFNFETDTGEEITFGFPAPTLDLIHDQVLKAIDTAIEDRKERVEEQRLNEERAEKCRERDVQITEICNEFLGISDYATMVRDIERVKVSTEGHRPRMVDVFNLPHDQDPQILCIPCREIFSVNRPGHIGMILALYHDHLDHPITLLRPCGLVFAEGKKAGESCKAPGVWVIDHRKLGRVQRCGKHSMKLRGSRKKNKKNAEQ